MEPVQKFFDQPVVRDQRKQDKQKRNQVSTIQLTMVESSGRSYMTK